MFGNIGERGAFIVSGEITQVVEVISSVAFMRRRKYLQQLQNQLEEFRAHIELTKQFVDQQQADPLMLPAAGDNRVLSEDTINTKLSKIERAQMMLMKMRGQPRKVVISAFMSELNMTKACAANYYQRLTCKR
jgi:hypothetical protein